MKRSKNGYIIVICCMFILIVPAWIVITVFCLPSQFEATYLGEMQNKYDAILSTEGKRIIVVGGSGVAFSQYSDQIEKELPDYKVVNFGLYAGLGSKVMLDIACAHVNEGDILIFSPEQNNQTLSMYFNGESMWQAVDGSFRILFDISGNDLSAMLGQISYFAVDKFNYFRKRSTPDPKGVYSVSSFNRYGDISYKERDENIMNGGYDPNTQISFNSDDISEEFISYLNNCARLCKKQGAALYYRYCPMNASAISQENRKKIDEYTANLQGKLEFQIIGNPVNAVMEAEWFYDTNFHLNSAGAMVNTISLIADLKELLKDSSSTELTLPQMPELDTPMMQYGDNSNQDCFLYEETEESLRIKALSSEGKERERLTIPTEYDGKPVTSFSGAVFSGNDRIREIFIQNNILCIEDNSFDGCTSLEYLVLTNEKPSSCQVAQGLLSGTTCRIIVPDKSMSAYLTDYFWSVHSGKINKSTELDGDLAAVYADIIEVNAHTQADVETKESIVTLDDNETEADGFVILYHGNGGVCKEDQTKDEVTLPGSENHMRTNTALGSQLFEREGYLPVSWNAKPDGTGDEIGFGSRIEKKEGLELYVQWVQTADASEFQYKIEKNEIYITKYTGNRSICAIPSEIDHLPVKRICKNAFKDETIETLYLPPSLYTIERNAFVRCSIKELYLFDTLYYIYDESFIECTKLTTLHINAATPPVYSGTYFDTFSDKYDWLLSIRDQKKIVLFSGSSGRFGYDSQMMKDAYPEYQIANMGVYAYTNALPQLMIIKSCMKADDILLYAPEFDTIKNQFCTTNALDPLLFAMMESNYDAVALLDLKDYTNVFDSLCSYLTTRSIMGGKNYSISPSSYDDEGNRCDTPTYNRYGDYILERPNGDLDILLQTYLAEYTVSSFPEDVIKGINFVFDLFLEKEIQVYFSYAPRNQSALSESSTLTERNKLQQYLENELCVPVISDIEDYLYSGVYFYLIDNHLSSQGVEFRTMQLIEDLKKQLLTESLLTDK